MSSKLKFFMLLSLLLSIVSTGCWDRIEPDEQSYVYVIGLEKGLKDNLRLTLQYATFKESGSVGQGGGSSDGMGKVQPGGTTISSVECPSFFTGINMLQLGSDGIFNLMHTKMLIISEELAKNGCHIYASPLIRYRQIRRTMRVIVVKENKVQDFIKRINPTVGKNSSKAIELLLRTPLETGFSPPVTFKEFYSELQSTYSQPIAALGDINDFSEFNNTQSDKMPKNQVTGGQYLPGDVPRKGGLGIDIYGTAVFDGDKMTGKLDGNETRMLLMCRGEFKRGFFTITDPKVPEYIIPLDVKQARNPTIKISFKDGKPIIFCRLNIEGDILSIQSRQLYEMPENIDEIEKKFVSTYKPILDETIRKCLNEYHSDAMGFGRHAAIFFPTVQKWEDYNWIKKVIEANVETEIDFKVRRTGIISKSMPIIRTDEEIGKEPPSHQGGTK